MFGCMGDRDEEKRAVSQCILIKQRLARTCNPRPRMYSPHKAPSNKHTHARTDNDAWPPPFHPQKSTPHTEAAPSTPRPPSDMPRASGNQHSKCCVPTRWTSATSYRFPLPSPGRTFGRTRCGWCGRFGPPVWLCVVGWSGGVWVEGCCCCSWDGLGDGGKRWVVCLCMPNGDRLPPPTHDPPADKEAEHARTWLWEVKRRKQVSSGPVRPSSFTCCSMVCWRMKEGIVVVGEERCVHSTHTPTRHPHPHTYTRVPL